MDWRDRAIRASRDFRPRTLNFKLKDRIVALELANKELEQENKTLYNQACVADEWDLV